MKSSDNFIFGDKAEFIQINEDTRRQILGYNDEIMMVKIEFKTGSIGSIHSHIHSQTTYVVSGVFEFQIGEKVVVVKTGDGLFMEPNVLHGMKCIEEGILIDTFAPVRQDFLSIEKS